MSSWFVKCARQLLHAYILAPGRNERCTRPIATNVRKKKGKADDRAAHRPCSQPAGNQPDHRLARGLPSPGAPFAGSAALGASPSLLRPIWSLLCAAQLQGCAGAQRPPHHHHRMREKHRLISKLPGFSSSARVSLAARHAQHAV